MLVKCLVKTKQLILVKLLVKTKHSRNNSKYFFSLFLASIYFPLLALIANAYTPNSLPNCPTPETLTCSASEKYRRLDGSCNNFRYPQFGRSRECFARMLPPLYGAKGLGHKMGRISKSAYALPNARHLSNEYHADRGVQDPIASHWTAQFGLLMAADMFKVELNLLIFIKI